MNSTILVALFSSSLALFGLTVGKDSKVSEFRQQWIDGLRSDVSEFLAGIQQLFGLRGMAHFKPEEARNAPSDERYKAIQKSNELESRIRLRLDLRKPLSKKLIAAIERLRNIAQDSDLLETKLLHQVRDVEKCTSALLEDAWKKVRKGERTYRICIWLSGVCLALSIIAPVVIALTPLHGWIVAHFGCPK